MEPNRTKTPFSVAFTSSQAVVVFISYVANWDSTVAFARIIHQKYIIFSFSLIHHGSQSFITLVIEFL